MTTSRTMVLLSALLCIGTAATSFAQSAAPQEHRMHGRMMGGNPEMMEHHVNHMAKRVDASPEQKTKLIAIAKAAQADMKPLHDQMRAGRERGMALLAAPTLDRAAIEQHRAAQTQLMDQLSRRRTQAMLEAAEVLSPEQRSKLANRAHPANPANPSHHPHESQQGKIVK